MPASPQATGAIDVVDVLTGVARRWPMVVLFTIIGFTAAVVFVTTASVQYTSSAKVIVENLATPFTRAQTTATAETPIVERDVNSQVEVLTSRDLAADVIDRRISDRTRARLSATKPGLLDRLLARFGSSSGNSRLTGRDRALAKYFKNLVVYPVERSTVIKIEYRSGDPAVAAEVANAVATAYVEATQSAQAAPINVARDWLSEQIEKLRDKVVQSEVAVEEYRARAGLIRGSSTNTLNSQELSELNSQIIVAAAARSEAAARAASIRDMLASTGTIDAASDVLNSPLIQRLREQQVGMRRRLAELSTIYLDNHPRIVGGRRELADLDKQVRSEVLKIVKGLEQQARIAAAREASLRESMNELKSKASVKNVDEVKLRALQREADANRTLLETFLNRFNDASAREKATAQPGLARIISTAVASNQPTFPKKGPIVLLATVAGLVLGLGLAFLIEVMAAAGRMQQLAHAGFQPAAQPVAQPFRAADVPAPTAAPAASGPPPRMPIKMPQMPARRPQAAPQEGQASPLASANPDASGISPSLCQLPGNPDIAAAIRNAQGAATNSGDEYTAGIRTVASWATGLHQTQAAKRLAFTALPGVELDAATAVLATGRRLASQNIRAVVIDCDLENGLMASAAELSAGPGLSELLAGSATFSDVIVNDKQSALHIIPIGQLVDRARQVLDKSRLEMVLDALEHAYDLVLVNSGKAEFPADQSQVALTSCHAALVLAQSEFSGPAGTLCAALVKSGMRSAQFATVVAAEHAAVAKRIAAVVNA